VGGRRAIGSCKPVGVDDCHVQQLIKKRLPVPVGNTLGRKVRLQLIGNINTAHVLIIVVVDLRN